MTLHSYASPEAFKRALERQSRCRTQADRGFFSVFPAKSSNLFGLS
jgi:hypothetical protein